MIRKVTKKMAAVPKSFMTASAPRQKSENPTNRCRFFFSYSSSSVALPIKMNAILTSSDGCSM